MLRQSATPQRHRCLVVADESGFVIAQMALLLVPLMMFAAMATDVGGWYLRAQKIQRAADAAALAGVVRMPDLQGATDAARAVAARNGIVDATPNDADDFLSGPIPQLQITTPTSSTMDVEVRSEAPSFFGRLVLDQVEIIRFATAEHVRTVGMGNPTSGLGTGTIPEAQLGLPNDLMWLAISGYCADREQGEAFQAGYYGSGLVGCGPSAGSVVSGAQPVPTFDPDAYTFVVEIKPDANTTNLAVYEPGLGCSETGSAPDWTTGPLLNFEIYGPSTSVDHNTFLATATPLAVVQPPANACIANSPSGDGWWPLANNLPAPGPQGGFYYIRAFNRHPGSIDAFPGNSFWAETGLNAFSLRATRWGENRLCAFSVIDPTCPQMYALHWLPLFRQIPNDESEFFLAEIDEVYAGERLYVQFFDAAEGIANLQFVDSNGQAMPFRWRYADTSLGGVTGWPYTETEFVPTSSTCSWQGAAGQPCLNTSNRDDWNDRFVEVEIEIPPGYECGADCWWKVRYVTNGAAFDRSSWAVALSGNPVRLIE